MSKHYKVLMGGVVVGENGRTLSKGVVTSEKVIGILAERLVQEKIIAPYVVDDTSAAQAVPAAARPLLAAKDKEIADLKAEVAKLTKGLAKDKEIADLNAPKTAEG